VIFNSLQQRYGGGDGVGVVCRKRAMCIGVKLAFIYVAVACGLGIGQPLFASATRREGDVIDLLQATG
jgi:hypothetical protein